MSIYIDKIVEQITSNIKVSGKTLKKIILSDSLIKKYQIKDPLTICYMIANNMEAIPLCQECNINHTNFVSTKKGFSKFCSKTCHSTFLSKSNKILNGDLNRKKSQKLHNQRIGILKQAKIYYENKNIRISELADIFNIPYSTLRKYLSDTNSIKDDNQKQFRNKNFVEKTDRRLYDHDFLETCSKHKQSLKEVGKELNVAPNTVRLYALKQNVKFNSISSLESKLISFIKTLDSNVSRTRKIIKPYEIDVYSDKHKLGIELHGEFWHNEDRVDINYHLKKQKMAEEANISLIQIFAHEWKQKKKIVESIIMSRMGLNLKIFARKLQFTEIDKNSAKIFFNENHLQGWLKCQYVFGLIDSNGTIVSAISFGKSRFHKDCDYEILRFANKLNTNVIGGFSKLIKNSQKILQYKKLVTYSHKRLFSGKVYEKSGFVKIHETRPGYFWFNIKNADIKSRHQTQKHKLKTKMSEIEYMKSKDYRRVFDCGQNVFILNIL